MSIAFRNRFSCGLGVTEQQLKSLRVVGFIA
jgi:hypothetical protein